MKPRVYISGKITGAESTAETRFNCAELLLESKGYEPVNPLRLDHSNNKTWSEFMRTDLRALRTCSYLYQLPDWNKSRGAQIEKHIADQLRIPILVL
jgi:hypothetical protein